MKINSIRLVAICCTCLLCSCSSTVESKAEDYTEDAFEAYQEKDYTKSQEIINKSLEYRATLSLEDQMKYDNAVRKKASELKQEVIEEYNDKFKDDLKHALHGDD